jgi:hypothetical protein
VNSMGAVISEEIREASLRTVRVSEAKRTDGYFGRAGQFASGALLGSAFQRDERDVSASGSKFDRQFDTSSGLTTDEDLRCSTAGSAGPS